MKRWDENEGEKRREPFSFFLFVRHNLAFTLRRRTVCRSLFRTGFHLLLFSLFPDFPLTLTALLPRFQSRARRRSPFLSVSLPSKRQGEQYLSCLHRRQADSTHETKERKTVHKVRHRETCVTYTTSAKKSQAREEERHERIRETKKKRFLSLCFLSLLSWKECNQCNAISQLGYERVHHLTIAR